MVISKASMLMLEVSMHIHTHIYLHQCPSWRLEIMLTIMATVYELSNNDENPQVYFRINTYHQSLYKYSLVCRFC